MNAKKLVDSRHSINTPAVAAAPRGRARGRISAARVSPPATSRARTPLSPLVIFKARAEARAILWQCGEFSSLPEAVDPLQDYALASGLVGTIGQDEVQRILADAFHAVVRGRR
jgi:hypothetical protein